MKLHTVTKWRGKKVFEQNLAAAKNDYGRGLKEKRGSKGSSFDADLKMANDLRSFVNVCTERGLNFSGKVAFDQFERIKKKEEAITTVTEEGDLSN